MVVKSKIKEKLVIIIIQTFATQIINSNSQYMTEYSSLDQRAKYNNYN